MKIQSLVLGVAFLFTVASCEAKKTVPNLSKAPDFSLPSATGKTIKLSSLKGKYVVLEWLNHGCPFVKKHYNTGNMQKLQKAYTKKGVTWLSIISSAPGKQGYSTPVEAKKHQKEKSAHPTEILLDPEGKVGKLYGARTTPHMFVIDPKGAVVYQGAIDSIRSSDGDDVKKAKNYVSTALDRLLAGKKVEMAKTKPYGCSVKYK